MASGSRSPSQHNHLPHSVDAEQSILSNMMNGPKWAIPIVRRSIDQTFFYAPAARIVFTTVLQLWDSKGVADFVSVTQRLREVGHLDNVGGPAYPTMISGLPTGQPILEHFLEILTRTFALREIINLCNESVQRAYEVSADPAGGPQDLFQQLQTNLDRVKSSLTGSTGLPELRDLSTLLGDNRPPPPPEIVKGLLHQGSKLIVGGTSKGRKTYSLLDLAISVACGVSWWGFECFQGRVCYVNFEIQEPFFCQRVDDICSAKGCTLPANTLMGWTLRGQGKGIEKLLDDLMTVLPSQDFVLIILDPIYKALGNRDENKAGDVASMMNEIERIAVRTSAAVAFGAHYSKGNQASKESIDRIGGSGVFARDPDSILTMTAHNTFNAFTVDPTLRNFPPIDPFVLRWQWPLFVTDASLDPADLKQSRNRPGRPNSAAQNAEKLLDLLANGGLRYSEFMLAAKDQFQIKEKAFEKYFSILRTAGRIQKVDDLWIVPA